VRERRGQKFGPSAHNLPDFSSIRKGREQKREQAAPQNLNCNRTLDFDADALTNKISLTLSRIKTETFDLIPPHLCFSAAAPPPLQKAARLQVYPSLLQFEHLSHCNLILTKSTNARIRVPILQHSENIYYSPYRKQTNKGNLLLEGIFYNKLTLERRPR